MDLSVVYSRAQAGIQAPQVQVETHLSNGLPSFHIVGMPETAVRESKERVRSALINSHFTFPDRRITINLAPADLPKEGGRFDLPIALGILCSSGQLPLGNIPHHEFIGELALDGTLRSVPGVLTASIAATKRGRHLVVPPQAAQLAARVPHSSIVSPPDLLSLCAHLNGSRVIEPQPLQDENSPWEYPDLNEVIGQTSARRALEIAACGEHNLLFFGPPGTGKTLLASRLPGILPPPNPSEALEALALHNLYGNTEGELRWLKRPFRSPHHSASPAAMIGGGSKPKPGEVSLAHGGVLFLDELPEFSRRALDMLREPLESGEVTVSRARHKLTYPAQFQLVAAMNPCPCGYAGDRHTPCVCSASQIAKYRQRISGPLIDRIDMHIGLQRLPPSSLLGTHTAPENSDEVRRRVYTARTHQLNRQSCTNAQLPQKRLPHICGLTAAHNSYIEAAMTKMNLSARAVHRCLRVARSIADLQGTDDVAIDHIGEAFAYRNPELAL